MICNDCGSQVPAGSLACPRCGRLSISVWQAPTQRLSWAPNASAERVIQAYDVLTGFLCLLSAFWFYAVSWSTTVVSFAEGVNVQLPQVSRLFIAVTRGGGWPLICGLLLALLVGLIVKRPRTGDVQIAPFYALGAGYVAVSALFVFYAGAVLCLMFEIAR